MPRPPAAAAPQAAAPASDISFDARSLDDVEQSSTTSSRLGSPTWRRRRPSLPAAKDMSIAAMTQQANATFKIVGGRKRWRDDVCYLLLRCRWELYCLVLVCGFILVNVAFALLIAADPSGLSGGDGSFRDAFFFSVQTFATIGYGRRSPISHWVDTVVLVEAMVSLVLISVVGGLAFSRVMKPTSRLVFARVACIAELNGVPTLRIRVCNERQHNSIFDARFSLTASFDRISREGHRMRIMRQLRLMQDTVPVFGATFTVCHAIDESSPLHGLDAKGLASTIHSLDLLVGGTDETYMAPVYAHHAYVPADGAVLIGRYFTNIIDAEGGQMDLARMHETTASASEASQHEYFVGIKRSGTRRRNFDVVEPTRLTREALCLEASKRSARPPSPDVDSV